ncbi:MAG: 50S rRNA methyltransferase [Cellvibrionaceae bacterium]|nr:50S rRNA methyltransferase [Cellvibrionaceae bacterium]|tara:strand:- start:25799 stop:27004 length:1206 start_codon:yes stop_codon:yes gene_type:complete
MSENTRFNSPYGHFELQRFPVSKENQHKQQPLRAWDAADEYLLQWIHENNPQHIEGENSAFILNDSFGALAVALHQWRRYWQNDSYLARRGCLDNLQRNRLDETATEQSLTLLDSLQWPEQPVDLIVIKIPKTTALLEHQLYHLRQVIQPQTRIVAAGMVKNVHTNTLKTFERILGDTTTSLARKKARLIFCNPVPERWESQSPYPSSYRLKPADLPEEFRQSLDFDIENHANVFSRASLDIGTRLFLQHLPVQPNAEDIIDLGCGNGLLGIAAAKNHPDARVHFVDESYMAVESAKSNAERALTSTHHCHFSSGDSLTDFTSESADIILNNPPFHQQTVVGDHLAWKMFNDAKRVLRSGGSLWVIGNRHLNYHSKLKRLFGNSSTIAADRKFVVLRAKKR